MIGQIAASGPARAVQPDWLTKTLQLESVAYEVSTGNGDRCDKPILATGLVLHDLASYDRADRPGVAQRFALGMGFGVLGAVPGSGADRAGLHAGDEIVAIDGENLEHFGGDAITARGDHARLTRFTDLLDQRLHAGPATLRVRNGQTTRQVTVTGTPACGGRIAFVLDGPLNAWSDGDNVAVTAAMMRFTRNDDELAFVVAHEMAHNLLHHAAHHQPEWMAMFGIGAAGIKRDEIAADAYAVDLLDRTRFQTVRAVALIHRTWPMVLLDFGLTHPGAGRRAELVKTRLAEIAARRGTIDAWLSPNDNLPLTRVTAVR